MSTSFEQMKVSNDLPDAVQPSDDGYCYLSLFAACYRHRAAALLCDFVPVPALRAYSVERRLNFSDRFSLHLYWSPSRRAILAHVSVSDNDIGLDANTVLSILPSSAFVGSVPPEHVGTDNPAIPVRSLVTPPRLADPLRRRFLVKGVPLLFAKVTKHHVENPFNYASVTAWTKFFPVVHVMWIRVRLVPAAGSCLAGVSLAYTWFGSQETDPDSLTTCLGFPAADVFVGGPPSVGTLAAPHSAECDFAHGFSHRIKPDPDVVGSPRFYRHSTSIPFGGNTADDTTVLYDVYLEFELNANLNFTP